jgi:predicted nucleotidyltransferase component of viral defense system
VTLPAGLAAVLPKDGARSWEVIAPVLPEGAYLAGGTALAVHLGHRVSRDLDFFLHRSVDLDEVTAALRSVGPFAVTLQDTGTLNGVFSDTPVQFLFAENQHRLEATTRVAGIEVAGIGDILAMKLKVVGDRGELRDYFDVMQIEQRAGRMVEEGLGLYMARYDVPREHVTIRHIVNGLGYFGDVGDDEAVPVRRDEIVTYWRKRQPVLIRNIGRFPPRSAPRAGT